MVVNCDQVWREISNYLENDVDPGVRASMDQHFRTCQKCRSVLEGTRNVVRLYSDERMIEAPTGFSRRLERRLAQEARTQRSGWKVWSAWLVPVAALLLFADGIRVANSRTTPHPMLSEHAQSANDIPPELTVVVSADAREFHVPGCKFIHNKEKERTLTAKEAMQEGYVPCVRCLRKYMETASVGRASLDLKAQLEVDSEEDRLHGTP